MTSQNHCMTTDDIDDICNLTNGYSGADMANLCREAALGPIRSINFNDIQHISPEEVSLTFIIVNLVFHFYLQQKF